MIFRPRPGPVLCALWAGLLFAPSAAKGDGAARIDLLGGPAGAPRLVAGAAAAPLNPIQGLDLKTLSFERPVLPALGVVDAAPLAAKDQPAISSREVIEGRPAPAEEGVDEALREDIFGKEREFIDRYRRGRVVADRAWTEPLSQVPDQIGRLKEIGNREEGILLLAALRPSRSGEPPGIWIVDTEAFIKERGILRLIYHRERGLPARPQAEQALLEETGRWDAMTWEEFAAELRDLSPMAGGGPDVLRLTLLAGGGAFLNSTSARLPAAGPLMERLALRMEELSRNLNQGPETGGFFARFQSALLRGKPYYHGTSWRNLSAVVLNSNGKLSRDITYLTRSPDVARDFAQTMAKMTRSEPVTLEFKEDPLHRRTSPTTYSLPDDPGAYYAAFRNIPLRHLTPRSKESILGELEEHVRDLPSDETQRVRGLFTKALYPFRLRTWAPASGTVVPFPPQESPDWKRDSFMGKDGAKIEYFLRKGRGPAILLLHGRTIGAEGFRGWADSFPGRPLVVLSRRGYGRSELGALNEDNLRDLSADDIEKAIAVAGALGEGRRVGVVALSLGAMLLPALDPARILWLALVNPGVSGMLAHMDPVAIAFSYAMKAGYEMSRFWPPAVRAGWISQTANAIVENLISRIRSQAGAATEHAQSLIKELRVWASSPRSQELLVRETLWALFGRMKESVWGPVPTFVGMSQQDEVIPQDAYQELLKDLAGRASLLQTARWPGGHLLPILEPERAIEDLEEFDRHVLGGRR